MDTLDIHGRANSDSQALSHHLMVSHMPDASLTESGRIAG